MIRDLVKAFRLDRLQSVLAEEGRSVRREVLSQLRDTLRAQLDRIDAQLDGLAGARRGRRSARGAGRAGGKRQGMTLKVAITEALKRAGKAVHVNDLAARVRKIGYKSRSTARNFAIQAYRALKDSSLFRKAGRGTYALKG